MARTSESGHAKNLANFETLISFVKGYGEVYNPTKNSIKVESLETIRVNSKQAIEAVVNFSASVANAASARKDAFAPLSKIITRVNNAVKATDTTEQVDDSVKTIVRKLQGTRASAKITDTDKAALETEGKVINQISSSQMSYDNRVANLYKLIMLLKSIPQYNPNEVDLKISTLTALHDDLVAKNKAVVDSFTPISNLRITRNEIMYKPLTGLVDVACDTKVYIKSVFGASSPQYKQVSKLVFKSLAK